MSYFLRNKTAQVNVYFVVITFHVKDFACKTEISYINQSY